MNISALYRIMGGDGKELYTSLRKLSRTQSVSRGIKQYNPKLHDVTDPIKRPSKIIFVPNGQKDPVTGQDILVQDFAPVTRVPVGFEQYIISQKATFAAGSGVTLKPSIPDQELYGHVSRNWYDNKTDYQLQDIFRQVMAYTEAAVIFYGEQGAESFDDFRYRMKVASPECGDKLEPFFNEDTDDLIAFGREYEIDGKTRYDFYVIGEQSGRVEIRRFENGALMRAFDGIDGEPSEVFVTPYTKLPIVYWSQRAPECDITSEMREEFEEAFNQFCTQMGYSGEAILFGRGTTMGLPAKGMAGKYMEGSADSDLKYVQAESQHESRGFQFDLMQKFIFGLNRSVFLDMETMKELGDVSGAALERYLMDAYMEATGKQQGYLGMGVQRMVNWLLHEWRELAGGDPKLRIWVEFQQYSVTSEVDRVELAMKANGGKPVVTHQRSIDMAGLEEDTEEALQIINSENNGNNSN